MILLVDVNLSPRVVERLRALRLVVERVGEVIDMRATDEEILAAALRSGAIVVNQDQDFSAILATTGAARPSLVNVRMSDLDAERIADRIAAAVSALATELASGAIVTIDDAGVRVHALPVG